MKTLIPYIIVFVDGFVICLAISPLEKEVVVTQTDTLETVIYDTLPGDTIWQEVEVVMVKRDTFYIIEVIADTIYIEAGKGKYVEIDTCYQGLPIYVRYDFPPLSLFTLQFGNWVQAHRRVVVKQRELIKPPRWTFETGVLAGYLGEREYRAGVCGSLFYKTVGGMVLIDNKGVMVGLTKRW